jgi:cellulose synthase/poly-beta-1,6-N-acetylglucosamine synthase-like glycosyltransferase
VERYQPLGFPIEYHHRTNREGFKAGALQEGLKTATGEFVAIFDADFVPPHGFPDAHHPPFSPIPRWAWCRRAGAI